MTMGEAISRATEIMLVGIQAPNLPLGRQGFHKWRLADAARVFLGRLVWGQQVPIFHGGRLLDRYGRLPAHLFVKYGAWVQAALLAAGLARVYSFDDNQARVAEMLELERPPRAARRGIWALDYYRILGLWESARHINSFKIVEGRVLGAADVRGRVYLNLGANWRTDFTIALTPEVARHLRHDGIEPAGLQGKRIRVRGWLKSSNGLMVSATHLEQIEVLE